jgi:hypothetical protein
LGSGVAFGAGFTGFGAGVARFSIRFGVGAGAVGAGRSVLGLTGAGLGVGAGFTGLGVCGGLFLPRNLSQKLRFLGSDLPIGSGVETGTRLTG